MKSTILFTLLLFATSFVNAQQIIEKTSLNNGVDECNVYNKAVVRHRRYVKEEHLEEFDAKMKYTRREYFKSIFDTSGMLISFKKSYLKSFELLSFQVTFRKINDTIFESTVTYSPTSIDIPAVFTDQVKSAKDSLGYPVFLNDSKGFLIIHSVYTLFEDGRIYEIKRYNINHELVQVWYPFRKNKPKRLDSDTSISLNGGINRGYALFFDENKVLVSIEEYGKRLKSKTIVNTKYSDSATSFLGEAFYFDDDGRCVLKIDTDEKHSLIGMTKFEYKDSLLIRKEYYDKSLFKPKFIWKYSKKDGSLVYFEDSSSKAFIFSQIFVYDLSGFKTSVVSNVNGKMTSRQTYKYY